MMNSNNSSLSPNYQTIYMNATIFGGIVVPGLILNTMAVIITCTVARKHLVPTNIFLATLAAVDLTSILLTTTPTAFYYIFGGWGQVEHSVCLYQGILSVFSTLATGSVATIISVDRFVATLRPLWYHAHRPDHSATKLVLGVLASSFAFSLLPLTGLGKLQAHYPGSFCTLSYSPQSMMAVGYALAFAVLCLLEGIIVVGCNLIICIYMFRYRRRVEPLLSHVLCVLATRRRKREAQYSHVMLAVSMLFIICWIPFMMRALCGLSGVRVSPEYSAWAVRLLLFKYTLDPCTYLLTRKEYRHAFTTLIKCHASRNVTPLAAPAEMADTAL
ncbi:prostaglandin E2 receptor EP3 subtype [Nematostella vectensis]|uniref:prostaglandin E2 receptor EP3 subtype n=1 Tax=Nematostella vectensis TaxID=45351 RepID=UPI0013903525|nr:prostaglandin E2 receptor EP3 subtype [Nematostella vectensis]